MQVLHLTPHLGGGVGRAISGLITDAPATVTHQIVCFEQPEKSLFIDAIRNKGCQLICQPDMDTLKTLVQQADIVQLEWWNHPATFACLSHLSSTPMRLVVWSHVSGLGNPVIPTGLINAAEQFVLTSACSYQAQNIAEVYRDHPEKMQVVSSNSGFAEFPARVPDKSQALSVGYMGSQNFAKLHPDYVAYLDAVPLENFSVIMVGDNSQQALLQQQAAQCGKAGLLTFEGFTAQPAQMLQKMNVMAYLLNPTHYGTTENALLEAMASGIVPVVLNNAAEQQIVEHGVTGMIVSSPAEFADAIQLLDADPNLRVRLANAAAQRVRQRFSAEIMQAGLQSVYEKAMAAEKQVITFENVFGATPAEWFLSCQPEVSDFKADGGVSLPDNSLLAFSYLEKTKGSVFHFQRYFSGDEMLSKWVDSLQLSIGSQKIMNKESGYGV